MNKNRQEKKQCHSGHLSFVLWCLDDNQDSDECEVVYEEILISDSEDNDISSTDEEVEYIYEIEYVEEDDRSKDQDDEDKQYSLSENKDLKNDEKTTNTNNQNDIIMPPPILLRNPPSFRKNVSFSSVHSVLTENDDVIYIDDDDDIFS